MAAAVVANGLTLQSAQAAFVMMLDDPTDSAAPVMVYDGGASDINGGDGVITYSGAIGEFGVTVSSGLSKPALGPSRLALNSLDISNAPGTLLVGLSDTDFSYSSGGFDANYGGTTDGEVSFSFRYDTDNAEFGGWDFAAGGHTAGDWGEAFSESLTQSVGADSDDAFSLSILAEISQSSGFQSTSFSAGITPTEVPLPAGGLLFGTALAGLLWRRRQG